MIRFFFVFSTAMPKIIFFFCFFFVFHVYFTNPSLRLPPVPKSPPCSSSFSSHVSSPYKRRTTCHSPCIVVPCLDLTPRDSGGTVSRRHHLPPPPPPPTTITTNNVVFTKKLLVYTKRATVCTSPPSALETRGASASLSS